MPEHRIYRVDIQFREYIPFHCVSSQNECCSKVIDLAVIHLHKSLEQHKEFISMMGIAFFDEVGLSGRELRTAGIHHHDHNSNTTI
jgi:hypothetical protein